MGNCEVYMVLNWFFFFFTPTPSLDSFPDGPDPLKDIVKMKRPYESVNNSPK